MLHFGHNRVISFLSACHLVERGCWSYLSHIHDTSVALPPSLDFVCVVRKFFDFFHKDFLGMPLDNDIDFVINIEPAPILFLFLPIGCPSQAKGI